MIECSSCGTYLRYRSQPHSCRTAFDPTVRPKQSPPVFIDTEREQQRLSLAIAIENAAADAESLINRGYSASVALVAAIGSALRVAEGNGFMRGFSTGRAYSMTGPDPLTENQHDDPICDDDGSCSGRIEIPFHRNDRFTSDNGNV